MTPESPTVRGWELGIRLRERRTQLGMTASQVGKAARCAQAYVSGVEANKVKLPAHRLKQLVRIYEIDDTEAPELENLRDLSTKRGWWHEYARILNTEFVRYLGYEAGASGLRAYCADVLHGMLQTEEYARAVIRAGSPYVRLTEADRRVQLRVMRQLRLDADQPLQVTAVLTEGVIRQRVGGAEVMAKQLDHLLELGQRKTVEVRVIPFDAGAYPALGGPFQILSFAQTTLPDLAWQETLTNSDIIDQPGQVAEHAVTFAETAEQALSVKDSCDLIRKIVKEMR